MLDASAAPTGAALRRRYANVAGILCAAGALFALPSALVLEPNAIVAIAVLCALGLVLAGVCVAIPWQRAPFVAIAVTPAAGTVLITFADVLVDPSYGFYLVLVGGFIAYAFATTPRVVAAHVGLIGLALAAPILIDADGTRHAAAAALIYGPGVVLLAGLGSFVRRRTEARERFYRDFAADALAIAVRIRSTVGTEPDPGAVPAPPSRRDPVGPRTIGGARVRRRGAQHPSRVRSSAPRGRALLAAAITVPVVALGLLESSDVPRQQTVVLSAAGGDRVAQSPASPGRDRRANSPGASPDRSGGRERPRTRASSDGERQQVAGTTAAGAAPGASTDTVSPAGAATTTTAGTDAQQPAASQTRPQAPGSPASPATASGVGVPAAPAQPAPTPQGAPLPSPLDEVQEIVHPIAPGVPDGG